MASENQIVVEIIADDGKVQKAILNVKQGGEKLGNTFDGLAKKSKKSLDETSGFLGNLEKSFKGVTGEIAAFGAKFGLIGVAINLVKGQIESFANVFVNAFKVSDQIKSINAQFNALAINSGVNADKLRAVFEEFGKGLVETNDVLKAASIALGNLQIKGEAVEKTFQIARKASLAYGVDTVEAFEAINSAIISGNTKALKQLGIFIDSQKAVDDFAKSIGVASRNINETGRQQAIFNAILEKSNTLYSGVTDGQEKASSGFKRLTVSVNELSNSLSILITKATSGFFNELAQNLSDTANAINRSLNPPANNTLEQKLANIRREYEEIERKLADIEKHRNLGMITAEENLQEAAAKKRLQRLREEEERIGQLQMKQKAYAGARRAQTAQEIEAEKQSFLNQQAIAEQRRQLLAQDLQIRAQNLDFIMQKATTEEQFEQAKTQRLLLIEEQKQTALAALKKQYADAGLLQTEQYRTAEQDLNTRYDQQALELTKQQNANMMKLKGIIQAGIVNGLANAFSSLGRALVTGANGFQEFGKAVLSALGGMAIQIGSLLVSIGLGFSALGPIVPIYGLAGGQAVAAGLGLIVLGGVLQALGGGGGETPAVSAGGGGSGGGVSGSSISTEPQLAQEAEKKPTQVVVNVQGNVLDRRETGLELVNVLTEYFDTNQGIIAST